MKTVTVFKIQDKAKKYHPQIHPTAARVEFATRRDPEGYTVEEMEVSLLEDGDIVELELHRGGAEDMDGIHHGGDWVGPVRGVVRTHGECAASVVDVETGRHIQSIDRIAESEGFPYRKVRVIN